MLIKHNKINEAQNNQIKFDIQNGVLKDVKNAVGVVIIPDGVTSIGDGAFFYCSSLTSITIPNSVTSIGNYAFCDCSSLTSITIPDGVTSIGNYAFEGCSNLKSIAIPNSVTFIGSSVFNLCEIKNLILPQYKIHKEIYKSIYQHNYLRKINGIDKRNCILIEHDNYIYLLHIENGVIDLGDKKITDVDSFKYISNVNYNYVIVKYKNGLYEPFSVESFESLTKGIKLKYIEYVYGDYPIGVREDGKKCFFTWKAYGKLSEWFNDCSFNSITRTFTVDGKEINYSNNNA